MDPKARRFLWNIITDIVKEGRTVILTSHRYAIDIPLRHKQNNWKTLLLMFGYSFVFVVLRQHGRVRGAV
jgi:hypothetical protein